MLATFNEILFKMPPANSMRFHVEMQVENCSEESVLFPCLPWVLLRPTQSRRKILMQRKVAVRFPAAFLIWLQTLRHFQKTLERMACECSGLSLYGQCSKQTTLINLKTQILPTQFCQYLLTT